MLMIASILSSRGGVLSPQSDMLELYGCETCMSLLSRHRAVTSLDVCNTLQGFESWRTLCQMVAGGLLRSKKWVTLWEETYGCHKLTPGGLALVAPCPAHAVCSWVASPDTRRPYCPVDHTYKIPPAPSDWGDHDGDRRDRPDGKGPFGDESEPVASPPAPGRYVEEFLNPGVT